MQLLKPLQAAALVMIFGDVVLSHFEPGQPMLIGLLFAILNGVLCTVALVWFLVVILKSLCQGAQVFRNGRTMLHSVMSFADFRNTPTGVGKTTVYCKRARQLIYML